MVKETMTTMTSHHPQGHHCWHQALSLASGFRHPTFSIWFRPFLHQRSSLRSIHPILYPRAGLSPSFHPNERDLRIDGRSVMVAFDQSNPIHVTPPIFFLLPVIQCSTGPRLVPDEVLRFSPETPPPPTKKFDAVFDTHGAPKVGMGHLRRRR